MGLKLSLRRNQLRLSEKSAGMAIFLGKQYLGQTDNYNFSAKDGMLSDLISGLREPDGEQE
jgi:hypothetical protein